MKIDFSFKGENIYRIWRRHFRAQFAADLVPKWRRFADALLARLVSLSDVTQHVDDYAIRVRHKEAANAPRLIG